MILLQAPAAGMTFGGTPSGSVYTSDNNAIIRIVNNSTADQLYLQSSSCYLLSAFGGWGTFTFLTLASLYAADSALGLVLPGVVGFPANTTAQVAGDPTLTNNGSWFKTGNGNGAGNWTYTPLLATSGAAQAAASAASAAISAGIAATSPPVSQSFPNTAATYLPKGITGFSISNAGTAGTNSTNNLATYSGGTFTNNPVIMYDVVGGLVTNLRVTFPGLYIGSGTPTLPTITLPNAGSGATLALVIGSIINAGQYYWVVSADGTQLLLYANNAGSPAAVMLSGVQAYVPLGGSLTAINTAIATINASITILNADIAQMSTPGTQVIGRPTATPPATGTANGQAYFYLYDNSAVQTGYLNSFQFYSNGATTLYLSKFTLSGGVFTQTWKSPAVTVTGTGLQTITNTQYNSGNPLVVNVGEYLGISDSTGNCIGFVSGQTADGAGWFEATGAMPTSFTPSGSPITTFQLQVQFIIGYTNLTVTASAIQALQTAVVGLPAIQTAVNGLPAINTSISTLNTQMTAANAQLAQLFTVGYQYIGRPTGTSPATGNAFGGATTLIMNNAVTSAGNLTNFNFYSGGASTIYLCKYTLSGGVFTRTWQSAAITITGSGLKSLTSTDFNAGSPLSVAVGDYLAVADATGSAITILSSSTTADGGGWYNVGSVAPSTYTAGSLTTNFLLEVQFIVTSTAPSVSPTAFAAVQTLVNSDHAAILALQAAGGVSTTTAKLINAFRTQPIFPAPTYRLATNDTPTFTYSSSPTISGTVVVATDTRFSWVGGFCSSGVDNNGGSGYPSSTLYSAYGSYVGYNASTGTTPAPRQTSYTAIEFMHVGTQFEISTLRGTFQWRVLVNDVEGVVFSDTVNDGSQAYYKVQFGASGTRRIRIEIAGAAIFGINFASPSSELVAQTRVYPLVTLMSDSFGDALGPIRPCEYEAVVMARALGWALNAVPVGTTGLINPGSTNVFGGQKVNFVNSARIGDLTLAGVINRQTGVQVVPDIGVIYGSVNDVGLSSSVYSTYGSTLQAAITKTVFIAFDAWSAANPGKPLVLFGPTSPSGPPFLLAQYQVRDGIAEACAMLASQNVHFIDRMIPPLRDGTWVQADSQNIMSGTESGTTIIAGASAYTGGASGTDPTHPTYYGHRFDGLWMAKQMRTLISTEFK